MGLDGDALKDYVIKFRRSCLAHQAGAVKCKDRNPIADLHLTTATSLSKTMSHLSNALATAEQLESRSLGNGLPAELQDSIRFSTARLTQAACLLLRLPQSIAAQAVVTLFRYWLTGDLMRYEFSVRSTLRPRLSNSLPSPKWCVKLTSLLHQQDISAASVYMIAKISASPRSLRSITNVYAYLLSPSSCLVSIDGGTAENVPESYYLSESSYITFRNRLLNIEGQILNEIGFEMHVALPHPLAITYLQTLDVFGASQPKGTGPLVAKRAVEYLNTALLSPQMLYLTHQPNALATAAIYLAARDVGASLPDLEWWEVFDTDREDLGFLALSMKSLEGWAKQEKQTWDDRTILLRRDIRQELDKRTNGGAHAPEDEEAEMMRLLDDKVA